MRYFFTAKLWVALGALAGTSALLLVLLLVVNNGGSAQQSRARVIDLVGAVAIAEVGEGWQVNNGKTSGDIALTLDDGRTMRIVDGTPAEVTCQIPVVSYACVMVADTLGTGVLWFALVPADSTNGKEMLTLPTLVDMLDAGDLGVLSNGWVVPLATPTVRNCESETSSLRDFINQFPDGAAVSMLNLYEDQITEVICT